MWWKLILLVLVGLVVAIAALLRYRKSHWRAGTRALRERLESKRVRIQPSVFDRRELEGLPEPVQQYFRTVLREGQPMVSAIRVEHTAGGHFVDATELLPNFRGQWTIMLPGDINGDGHTDIVALTQGHYSVLANVKNYALGNSAVQFALRNRGGLSMTTAGSSSAVITGYASVRPDSGSSAPPGIAIFGYRQNNILVSEAGVPASPTLLSGRIYAEVNGPVNTGLAMANPNGRPATVQFYFTDSSGDSAVSSTTIPPNAQIAAFLNEAPFNGKPSFSGTLTFTSSEPVAVIALRGFTNQRSEFLITTLPVVDLSIPPSISTLVFPHFADGGGWTTQIILVNPGNTVLAGNVLFDNPSGKDVTVSINNQMNSNFSYSIPPRSSYKVATEGLGAPVTVGAVRVIPTANNLAPSGVSIFAFKSNGITVSEAGVPVASASPAFRLYAEASGNVSTNSVGSVQTGLAVANTSSNSANVTLELFNLDGSNTGLKGTLSLSGNGQIATFLNQVQGLGSLASPFRGVLRVSSTVPISVVGLRGRINERSDFLMTTTPPINEISQPSAVPLYFPHYADGGGFTTQFILFTGQVGQSSSGTLQFFGKTGTPLNLILQ